jgi:hypothetical protein
VPGLRRRLSGPVGVAASGVVLPALLVDAGAQPRGRRRAAAQLSQPSVDHTQRDLLDPAGLARQQVLAQTLAAVTRSITRSITPSRRDRGLPVQGRAHQFERLLATHH